MKKHKSIDPDVLADNKWSVDNYAEAAWGIQMGPAVLNVHSPIKCAGRPCVVHNPSDHHMRDWPVNFRFDKYQTERTCPHGIGHPDPDDMAYQRTIDNAWKSTHGCDGCCVAPGEEE